MAKQKRYTIEEVAQRQGIENIHIIKCANSKEVFYSVNSGDYVREDGIGILFSDLKKKYGK